MRKESATVVRVYHHHPLHGACSLCLREARMTVIDLDRELPICRECVPVSIAAAGALRAAGIVPPDSRLTELNP